jgi:hypothetical protein
LSLSISQHFFLLLIFSISSANEPLRSLFLLFLYFVLKHAFSSIRWICGQNNSVLLKKVRLKN